MYNNIQELTDVVDNFCKTNNIPRNMFEVSPISENATGGEKHRLYNTSRVINENCNFVIKYYRNLNLIVIWNYTFNHNMSYSYITIRNKLKNGIKYSDKGSEFHTRNQYLVYFDEGRTLNGLLHLICGIY